MKTEREAGTGALATYVRGAVRRERIRQQTADRRRQRAQQIARTAANILKSRFGATRVVLFGSVAHGQWFHNQSDIDLMAEGIPAEDFWGAWCALDAISREFEINLLAGEMVSNRLRLDIDEYGIVL